MKKFSKLMAITLAAALMLAGCGAGQTPSDTTGQDNTANVVDGGTVDDNNSGDDTSKDDVADDSSNTGNTDNGTSDNQPEPEPEVVGISEAPKFEGITNDSVEFAAQLKLGWNLGNTLDATAAKGLKSETSWGQPVTTKEMIDYVAQVGFTTIRIPVSWGQHTDADYNIDEEWMARVTEVVDYAMDAGLYVILNSHHDNDYYYPSEENYENAKVYLDAIWTQIAANFSDYDERLIFESMNEPRLAGTDIEWWFQSGNSTGRAAIERISAFDQVFVNAIRSGEGYNTSRYLMVSSYAASPDFTLHSSFTIPEDPAGRILISIHAYTPYDFAMNMGGYDTWDGTKSSELNFIDKLNTTFVEKGYGVVIGEFGCTNKDNLDSRIAWASEYTAKAASYGIPSCIWDNGGTSVGEENFGMIDRKNLKVYFPELLAAYLSGYAQ